MAANVNELFRDGDSVYARTVEAESNDPGSCAVHVLADGQDPAVSIYLAPVEAAILGAELIGAARKAVPPEAEKP